MKKSEFHIFKKNTDATATNKGFYYQYLTTLKQWLKNYDNTEFDIYCETEDDILEFNKKTFQRNFTQVKCYSSDFTIESNEIIKSIINFFNLFLKYDQNFNGKYTFTTNAGIKPKDRVLFEWQNKQSIGNFDVTEFIVPVRDVLTNYVNCEKSKYLSKCIESDVIEDVDDKFHDFISKINSSTFITFLENIRWEFVDNIENAIEIIIQEICLLINKLNYNKSIDVEIVLSYLLHEIIQKSSQKNIKNRLLNSSTLNELIKKTENKNLILRSIEQNITEIISNFFNLKRELKDIKDCNEKIIEKLNCNSISENTDNRKIRNSLFIKEITQIYEQLGFSTTNNQIIYSKTIDIISEKNIAGIGKIKLLVKCFYGDSEFITSTEIYELSSFFQSCKHEFGFTQCIVVSNKDFTKDVRQLKFNEITLITIYDLERQILDLKESLLDFIKKYEKENIYNEYIFLSGLLEINNRKRSIENITEEILKIALKKSKKNDATSNQYVFLTILGDYGSGKTTILNKIRYEIAKFYLENVTSYKPLYIELKNYYKFTDIEVFICNSFFRQYNIEIKPELLWKEIQNGKFIILLDGFDEMALQVNRQKRLENFLILTKLLSTKSLCILTCRPSYFISKDEYIEAIEISNNKETLKIRNTQIRQFDEKQKSFDMLNQRLRKIHIEKENIDLQKEIISQNIIIEIEPLNANQIADYLKNNDKNFLKKCNSNWEDIHNFINSIYDLSDLMSKPMLLSLIKDTILLSGKNYSHDTIKNGPAALYDIYTDLTLDIDWNKGETRHFLNKEQRREFAEAIAFTMLNHNILEVEYNDIISIINQNKSILTNLSNIEDYTFDEIATDIQICSFLTRTNDNSFKFVHQSFMEFFVARFIKMQFFKKNLNDILITKALKKEILYFIGSFAYYDPKIISYVKSLVANKKLFNNNIIKRNIYSIIIYSNSIHDEYSFTNVDFGSIDLKKINFNVITFEKTIFQKSLFLEDNFENSTFNEFELTLSTLNTVNFEKVSFKKVSFENNTIHSTVFLNVKILESNFNDCQFKKSIFNQTTFYNSTINEVQLDEFQIISSKFMLCQMKMTITNSTIDKTVIENSNILLSCKNSKLDSNTINDTKVELIGTLIINDTKFMNSTIGIKSIGINGTSVKFEGCQFNDCFFIGSKIKCNISFKNCTFNHSSFVGLALNVGDLKSQNNIFNDCLGLVLVDNILKLNIDKIESKIEPEVYIISKKLYLSKVIYSSGKLENNVKPFINFFSKSHSEETVFLGILKEYFNEN